MNKSTNKNNKKDKKDKKNKKDEKSESKKIYNTEKTPVPYWAPAAGALPVATERGAAEMETAGTNEGEKKGRRKGKKRSGNRSRRTKSSQKI